jgi:hypothetical protein
MASSYKANNSYVSCHKAQEVRSALVDYIVSEPVQRRLSTSSMPFFICTPFVLCKNIWRMENNKGEVVETYEYVVARDRKRLCSILRR